ncbi:hypothetical protein F2P56_035089 [Juglans regia]|uniref:Uncharacterized protein n=1 Tax=Juglans regia TaxID=51240 RepID=A0A833WS14_JUGRE|nr:hypothetical protein F2P56_035089 [Juglans regia]
MALLVAIEASRSKSASKQDRELKRLTCSINYDVQEGSSGRGASGGVLLMWDKRVVEAIEECIGEFSVSVLFKKVSDGWIWAFAGSYGPNIDRDRRRLWEELAGIHSSWDVP